MPTNKTERINRLEKNVVNAKKSGFVVAWQDYLNADNPDLFYVKGVDGRFTREQLHEIYNDQYIFLVMYAKD